MAHFLLIHGSCHGAWCWRDMLPLLNSGGHTASAIDLPSHGDDRTPVNDVTLDSYADAIIEAIDEPVVLVGHSMAGYPISAAAEKAPEKITRLVYLCAYLPAVGKSLVDRRISAPRQLLQDAIVRSDDGKSFTIDPTKAGEKLYTDCAQSVVDYANENLCPQAILPQATVLDITENLKNTPKTYIRCMNDHTIPPEFQVTMTADWPAGDIYEMQSSHSPFFAQPGRLAEILFEVAENS